MSSGVHDRDVAWSPDGKYIAFISDKTGEDEIYIIKQDGTEPPVQLTKNADTYKYAVTWSPDARSCFGPTRCYGCSMWISIQKQLRLLPSSKEWEYTDFNWSPDSKWIAYTEPVQRGSSRDQNLMNLPPGKAIL